MFSLYIHRRIQDQDKYIYHYCSKTNHSALESGLPPWGVHRVRPLPRGKLLGWRYTPEDNDDTKPNTSEYFTAELEETWECMQCLSEKKQQNVGLDQGLSTSHGNGINYTLPESSAFLVLENQLRPFLNRKLSNLNTWLIQNCLWAKGIAFVYKKNYHSFDSIKNSYRYGNLLSTIREIM